MMRGRSGISLLVAWMMISFVECRRKGDSVILVNRVCTMVDDATYDTLNANLSLARTYQFYPLVEYSFTRRALVMRDDGCKSLKDRPSANNFKGKFISELSNKCSISKQVNIAIEAGAVGLIIVVRNNITNYPFKMDLRRVVKKNVPVVVLTENMYLRLVNVTGPADDLTLTLRAIPPLTKFTPSMVLFHVIALVCLVVGSWLSVHGLNGLKFTPVFGSPKPRTASEEALIGTTAVNDQCTNQFSGYFPIGLLLLMATGILLLLYFFYDIFVWVLIVLIMIVFAVALKSALMEIICRLPTLKDMEATFVIDSKLLKCCLGVPELDKRSLVIFPFCLIPSVLWIVFRKDDDAVWIIQDLLGIIACIYIVKTLRLGSLKYITVLSVMFFTYDIFMVYITPLLMKPAPAVAYFKSPLWNATAPALRRVKRAAGGGSIMEDVASGAAGTSGESLPMLFKLPAWTWSFHPMASPCSSRPNFSMLGFGDIVVPGIVTAFAFLCDCRLTKPKAQGCCRFLYFPVVLAGYHVGLALVFVILVAMNTGQPALLTLMPCTVLPLAVIAGARGEMKAVWSGALPELGVRVADEDAAEAMAGEEMSTS